VTLPFIDIQLAPLLLPLKLVSLRLACLFLPLIFQPLQLAGHEGASLLAW
jgi:hypothetical protein